MSLEEDHELINKFKKTSKAFLLFQYRLIVVIFAFFLVLFVGLKIPEILNEMGFRWTSLDVGLVYGAPILGGAIILATLKFLAENITVLWTYISKNESDKIIEFYSGVFVAVLGFSVANLSIKEILPTISQAKNSPSVFLNFKTPSAFLATGNGSTLPVFFITFPERSAALAETDAQRVLLENLVETLAECSKIGNEGRQNIKIQVVGFASSSGTDTENKKLSIQRSEWVKSYLEGAGNGLELLKDKITVLQHTWETFTDMRDRRIFVDEHMFKSSGDEYSEKAGALNRRVEIHLLDVGGCQA